MTLDAANAVFISGIPEVSGERSAVRRRAVVVEDEPMVAALTASALEAGGFDVRVAHNALEARRAVDAFDPDIAILDVGLGAGPSGVDLAHILSRRHQGLALVVLTRVTDLRALGMSPADLPESCIHIPKSTIISTDQLLEIIDDVLRDRGSAHEQQTTSGPLSTLSRGQLDVLRKAAQGYSTPEIARQRNCTTSAVEKLLGSVYLDLGISAGGPLVPRSEAIRVYIAHAGIPDRP